MLMFDVRKILQVWLPRRRPAPQVPPLRDEADGDPPPDGAAPAQVPRRHGRRGVRGALLGGPRAAV